MFLELVASAVLLLCNDNKDHLERCRYWGVPFWLESRDLHLAGLAARPGTPLDEFGSYVSACSEYHGDLSLDWIGGGTHT